MLKKKQLLVKYSWKICQVSIPITIVLYLIRVMGFLSFLPGGIILFLMIISILSLLSYLILQTYN